MSQPISFAQFSKKIDEEMKLFASYMMTRAMANEDSLAEHYMIMLTTLTRGVSLVEMMLEEEGLSKTEIETAKLAMDRSNNKVREGYEQLKRDR
jgi:predicted outer membrane protein